MRVVRGRDLFWLRRLVFFVRKVASRGIHPGEGYVLLETGPQASIRLGRCWSYVAAWPIHWIIAFYSRCSKVNISVRLHVRDIFAGLRASRGGPQSKITAGRLTRRGKEFYLAHLRDSFDADCGPFPHWERRRLACIFEGCSGRAYLITVFLLVLKF